MSIGEEEKILLNWMEKGVTIRAPSTVSIDASVELAQGVCVESGCTLRGKTVVGEGAVIGPGTDLVDSVVGKRARISRSVVEQSVVGDDSTVGPYAHLRGGAELGSHCRVGNFVEIKASKLEDGVKVAHLSYLGDATIERGANIGAGTITCNYDGSTKHPTFIGEGAFVGSDSILVAPLRIGKGAWVAAGSVITRDIPPGALGVGRSRQKNVEGWADRKG
ncbi:hypothetical protein H8D30_02650 [bacterium]|nr:hypothetical protein [bacterium]